MIYAKDEPLRCPQCNDTPLEHDDPINVGRNHIVQNATCPDCGLEIQNEFFFARGREKGERLQNNFELLQQQSPNGGGSNGRAFGLNPL